MTAITCLARYGDCIGVLPMARHIHNTGETPHFVVHFKYASLLQGVSYAIADSVHFALDRTDLALKYAKGKYETVYQAQCFGKHWLGSHDEPYNLRAWLNCGFTKEQFHDVANYPLVFDRRDAERESFLIEQHIKTTKPLMLVSVGCGRSSPFASHHILQESLIRKWGEKFEILDLCHVKAARIYDLLALFDRAAMLITTDTCPLHLSTATPKLPVIALLNDKTFVGSLPRIAPYFSCGYSEAVKRMAEIHNSIAKMLSLCKVMPASGGRSMKP